MSDNTALPATRIYTSPGVTGRPTISTVVTVLATIYGVFEIWRAWQNNFQSQFDLLFGIFFIGGGIYGFNKTWNDSRDVVVTLDRDEAAGKTTVGLWRPFRPLLIETGLDGLTDWRHFIKVGPRDLKLHFITADLAGYPRPVRFELPRGQEVPEALRRLAPEAVTEYEELTGLKTSG
jgi:hypothetical protein